MQGHIYALINPSLQGLVKVGKTTRDPEERAKELSAATGVPMPFIVAYSIVVADCDAAELFAHEMLAQKGYRLSANREFFQAPLNDIIKALILCEAEYPPTDAAPDDSEKEEFEIMSPAEALMAEAKDFSTGENGVFQDYLKAEKLLLAATRLGCAEAYYELGLIYCAEESGILSLRKSNDAFQKAMDMGHDKVDCLSKISFNFISQGNKRNASSAFMKIFNECKFDEVMADFIHYGVINSGEKHQEHQSHHENLINLSHSLRRASENISALISGKTQQEIIEENSKKAEQAISISIGYFIFLGHETVSFIDSNFLSSAIIYLEAAAEEMLSPSMLSSFYEGVSKYRSALSESETFYPES